MASPMAWRPGGMSAGEHRPGPLHPRPGGRARGVVGARLLPPVRAVPAVPSPAGPQRGLDGAAVGQVRALRWQRAAAGAGQPDDPPGRARLPQQAVGRQMILALALSGAVLVAVSLALMICLPLRPGGYA